MFNVVDPDYHQLNRTEKLSVQKRSEKIQIPQRGALDEYYANILGF